MKNFCTEGPINKEKNYYLPREELLELGLKKIDDWRYFTIFAPRQSGKTTYFQLLIDEIKEKKKDYLPFWITFESFANVDLKTFFKLFYLQLDDSKERTALSSKIEKYYNMPELELYIRELSPHHVREYYEVRQDKETQ